MRGFPLFLLLVGCSSPEPTVDRAPYADLLKEANRLRIRSGGLCHRVPSEERTLVTVDDAVTVRKVAEFLRIPPPPPNGEITRCRCCGDPTLEFFRGEVLIVAIGLHHGTMIRSEAIGDEALTKTAAQQLCGWLADSGVPEPEASRRRIHAR